MNVHARVTTIREYGAVTLSFTTSIYVSQADKPEMVTFDFTVHYSDDSHKQLRIGDAIPIEIEMVDE